MHRSIVMFLVIAAAVGAAAMPAAAAVGKSLPTPIPSMVGERVAYTCGNQTFAGSPAGGEAMVQTNNGIEVFMAVTNSQWVVKAGPVMASDNQLWLGFDIAGGRTGWLPGKCFKVVTSPQYKAVFGNPMIVVQPTPTPTPVPFTIGEKVQYTCANMTFAGGPNGGEAIIVNKNGTSTVFMAVTNSQWVVNALPKMGSDNQLWLGLGIGNSLTGWLHAKCFKAVLLRMSPVQLPH
jgi:hypothetical protein